MTRNLLNTINIDVPAAVADETVAFWSAALGASPLRHEDAAVHDPRERRRPEPAGDPDDRGRATPASTSTSTPTTSTPRSIGSSRSVPRWSMRQWKDHPGRWVVMRDPAGNEFCLVDGTNPLRGPQVLEDFDRRARTVGGSDPTEGTRP